MFVKKFFLSFFFLLNLNICFCEPIDFIATRTIFCFWTGDNQMSSQRKACLNKLIKESGCNVILITKSNLHDWIKPEAPLHPAYDYLSFTHKADYLRTYFMHFYGGGYSDIKTPSGCWLNAFTDMEKHSTCLINGYHERNSGDVAYEPHKIFWEKLAGNCAYIMRPGTALTSIWYDEMIKLLDSKLNDLKKFPAKDPQDCKEKRTGYPIEWNEMLGRIFHKHQLFFYENTLFTLPKPIFQNYR